MYLLNSLYINPRNSHPPRSFMEADVQWQGHQHNLYQHYLAANREYLSLLHNAYDLTVRSEE